MEERTDFTGSQGQSLVARVKELGPIDQMALGALLLSIVLVLGSPYLAANRRQLILLFGVAVCLGAGSYVMYDHRYVMLNLDLADVHDIRSDCLALLQRAKKETDQGQSGYALLVGTDIPPSLARFGAKSVEVTDGTVRVCLWREKYKDGESGLLYDPGRRYVAVGFPHEVRSAWPRDFYEYRIREDHPAGSAF